MSHVSNADSSLLLNVSQERSLVVDHEVEDAVLVGKNEVGAVDSLVLADMNGLQGDAVERRQHGELELKVVALREVEGLPIVPGVLGDRDAVGL